MGKWIASHLRQPCHRGTLSTRWPWLPPSFSHTSRRHTSCAVSSLETKSSAPSSTLRPMRRLARIGVPGNPSRRSSICLIVTPSGEFVFLDLNPNGQWLWLEADLGLPLVAAMADLLTTGYSRPEQFAASERERQVQAGHAR